MGLLDNLKNAIFEGDPEKKVSTQEEKVPETPIQSEPEIKVVNRNQTTQTVKQVPLQSTIANTPLPPRHIDDVESNDTAIAKFREFFNTVLTNANLEGNDYYEFRKALDAQSGYGFTEIQMFQSVYAVLSSQGCDIDTLTNSGEHYLQILQSEKNGFEEALQEKRVQQIEQRKLNITVYEDENKALEQQIEDIRQQISQNHELIAQEMQGITDSERELRNSEENFNRAFLSITEQITKDIGKIKQYLPSKA